MDEVERARVRLEHWIQHNDHHQEEYETLARLLDGEGKKESAEYIREMISLSVKSNDYLRKALSALK